MKEQLNLLMAEDDENDVILLRIALSDTQLAAKLQTVRNGQEAMEYLEGKGEFADRTNHPFPDLVVLDLKMPVADGMDFLRWRQQAPRVATMPVIVLSGTVDKQAIEQTQLLGANDYLAKPLSIAGWRTVAHQLWALGRR